MPFMKTSFLAAILALAAGALIGCDGDDAPAAPTSPQPTATDASAALPANLFLDKAPENVQELAAAKKSAKAGDDVIIRGRVAGQKDPIAANRAILTLLDAAVNTCERMPGDTCPTPWDACCEPRETLQANTATIQVVDAAGRPLKTGLRGVGGIEPLKELVVVGKVKSQDATTLVIDATAIYVKS
jgi:hypothetical protein